MIADSHLNEMKLAFPGQNVEMVPCSSEDASHIRVPRTDDNESLLKRRGYLFEREATALRVYFPSPDWM